MIPILFNSTETQFASNGLGRLMECVKCQVTEKRNDQFECVFVYPITGRHYNELLEGLSNGAYGKTIFVTHDDTRIPQPFDIYAHEAPINGLVTFYARHISYRLAKSILKPFSAGSITEAFSKFSQNIVGAGQGFTFWTDKSTVKDIEFSRMYSVREALGGVQGSILDVYGGGEYEFDKFAVKLYQNRGQNKDIEIRYGKNLVDLMHSIDAGKTYNAIAPYWMPSEDMEGQLVTLPEVYISRAATLGQAEAIVPLDLSTEFSTMPTEAQLRARATAWLESTQPWIIDENLKVDFVNLWQTPEYANVAPLQHARLCDRVSVFYPQLGVSARNKEIIETVYDTLLDRYVSMEIGAARLNFTERIKASVEDDILKQVPSNSTMQQAIDRASSLITGGQGGYVYIAPNANGQPEEIYILDQPTVADAVNVLRINRNGIGFSDSGVSGTYASAWTLDGHFVADFIDTGTLNANLLRAGTIAGVSGSSYWNLETGELYIAVSSDDGQEAGLGQIIKINSDGLHVGKAGSTGEVIIDNVSVNIAMNGQQYSKFAGNYVQFGNYQLRRTADGGLAFKMKEE